MKQPHFEFRAVCIAAALLAGCGGSQPPINALGTPLQSPATAMHVANGLSWISQAKGKDFVYVGGTLGSIGRPPRAVVGVGTYPELEFLGEWTGKPYSHTHGLCSDTAGDVFALVSSNIIIEFAHGGTSPIKSLRDPSGAPSACSVDPTTGNLAVVNTSPTNFVPGVLLIYQAASGTPTSYKDNHLDFYYVGYDNKGNLFLDGIHRLSRAFRLAELPSGGSPFKNIELDKVPRSAGIVQWDGAYMTVSDAHVVYRFTVNGNRGTVIGSTRLKSPSKGWCGFVCSFGPAWIHGNVVLGGEATCPTIMYCFGAIGLWHYPKGGRPFNNVRSYIPSGITVSVAPK